MASVNHLDPGDVTETFEVKVHPALAVPSGMVYSEDAINLAPDKVVGLMALGEPKEEQGLLEPAPEYKPKLYPCPECHKVFRHPMSLHHHRHVHKGTYTCHSCGKVFSRRWDLHRHLHRSKMGCRRPNHVTATSPTAPAALLATPATPPTTAAAAAATAAAAAAAAAAHRAEFALDLNNPPSN